MECPKCHKEVGENDSVCENCGVKLKDKKTKNIKEVFHKKKKDAKENLENVKKKALSKKAKIVYIIASIVLIALLIILLIVHISGEKGNKIASEYAEYIGENISDAEKETEYSLKKESFYKCLNSAKKFDKIFESEDKITIDDISLPEWSVMVNCDDSKKIDNVVYTDFTQIKSDFRGEKKDKLISLERFDKGVKFNTIADEIDLEPYSITYKKGSSTYVYKYYYMTDYGDAQAVMLSVVFDYDNKYVSSSEDLIYPQNL